MRCRKSLNWLKRDDELTYIESNHLRTHSGIYRVTTKRMLKEYNSTNSNKEIAQNTSQLQGSEDKGKGAAAHSGSEASVECGHAPSIHVMPTGCFHVATESCMLVTWTAGPTKPLMFTVCCCRCR